MVSDVPHTRKLREHIHAGEIDADARESEKFERIKLGGILLAQSGLGSRAFTALSHSLAESRNKNINTSAFQAFVAAREDALNATLKPFIEWGNAMQAQTSAQGEHTPLQRMYIRYNALQERNISKEDRRDGCTPASQMLADGFATGIRAIWYAILCIPVLYKEQTGKVMSADEFNLALLRSRNFIFARAFASSAQNDVLFAKAMLDPDGRRSIDEVATFGIDALQLDISTLTVSHRGPRVDSDMIDFLRFQKDGRREEGTDEIVGCPAPHVAVHNGVQEYPNLIAGMIDEISDYARETIGSKLDEYTTEALSERTS